MKTLILITTIFITITPSLIAKKTHSGRTKALTPQEQLAGFTVPEGFIVELVASEKDGIVNPIDLTFDHAGRLWTQTARMYPLDPVKDIKWNDLLRLMDNPKAQDKNPEFKRIKDLYQGKTKGKDDILILSNIYGKEKPVVKKFATGLTIPQSILPYKKGVFVAQGSELFFLNSNGKRTPVLTGFGFTDTHTMAHSLVRAPGGWINFSQGALNKGNITSVRSGEKTRIDYSKIARFSLDGSHIQLVTAGLNNIWGFQLRGNGQWYLTEANDLGLSVTPAEPSTAFKGIGNEKLRPYQPFLPALHKFRVGGTGISGLAFADDTSGSFPASYRDVAFLANPITSTINCVKIIRNPDGSVTAKHLPNLLTSKDDWFRPVNIEFGPDGCLYIADWYNKIVSHNELPTTHPDRDTSHGRIWRIRHKSQQPRTIPNLYKASNNELFNHLLSPSLWEKRSAAYQIADRNATELIPNLEKLATSGNRDTITRIHALWALEGLGSYKKEIIRELLNSKDGDIRRETIRSLNTFKPSPTETATLLQPLVKDSNAMVRSQILRTLEKIGKADLNTIDILVSFCHPASSNNNLGDGYEINFERYLARRALEKYPAQLTAYLASDAVKKHPSINRVWAQQALGKQASNSFPAQWKTLSSKPLDKDALVIVSDLSSNPSVRNLIKPYFSNITNAPHIARLALKHIPDAYTPEFGFPLAETTTSLIQSGTKENIILGLQLARAYRITHLSSTFAKLYPETQDNTVKKEILLTLSHLPNNFAELFQTIYTDTTSTADLRLTALGALVQARGNAAQPQVTSALKNPTNSTSNIVIRLGNTTQGCSLLLKLVTEKILKPEDIPLDIVDRIHHLHSNHPTAQTIQQMATDGQNASIKTALARIPTLEKLNQDNNAPADIATGKAIFSGMCLSCHVVGDQGSGIGPALDGSSKRDTAHLLTAIFHPDAAVESAYVLYRVIESSGHIHEGLKKRDDARGSTIANQGTAKGGNTTFIPQRTIQQKHHVGSRSFMPTNFTLLPDPTLKALLAYMRSL